MNAPQHADPLSLVNPLCGTDSEQNFSTGLVYPAVAVPWGMTFFSPRNRPGGHVFSRRRSWPVNHLDGFTACHAPSPWMGDYGSFTLTPGHGLMPDRPSARRRSYRLDEEVSRPDYYRCRLLETGIDCELTASNRCGVLRMVYPRPAEATLVLQLHSPLCEASVDKAGGRVTGVARNGNGLVDGYGCHFAVDLGRPIDDARPISPATPEDGGAIELRFKADADEPVVVRIATSFISVEQAQTNLDREVGGKAFEQVQEATADLWRTELNRIQITGGTGDQRRTFYTCLWRALLFPRSLAETNAAGETVHRSPYTGKIEAGPLVTDNGFWDTSRAVYPMLALAWRKKLGEIHTGWIAAFEQSGWMPQWASPGHRACMVGTHSAAVFADAICKDVQGFDHAAAYASMKKDADEPGDPEARFGRQQLPEYQSLGYCPETGERDSVCRTLDYSYNDWCVAAVARKLGKDDEADFYEKRSGNWRKLFDEHIKFFRPKNAAGEWAYDFDEFIWGGPYREGGAWQYRFAVPHDPAGLADLMGGPDELAKLVEKMVETPASFVTGEYGFEIHEMTEMAGAKMGQYAHSNQPVHAFLWMPARAGRPDVTDKLVRRVLLEQYSPEVFPGDEDNGEMGAWFVTAALGLFGGCPGDPTYTTTPPLFDSATITGDDGVTIRLARGDGDARRDIAHADLMAGAREDRTLLLPRGVTS